MAGDKQQTRRHFLSLTAGAMGIFGAGAAGWVLLDSMNPAADMRPEIIDLSSIKPGGSKTVALFGGPILIHRRSQEELRQIRAEDWRELRYPESDESRIKKGHDEWLIVVGVCTLRPCGLLEKHTGDWNGWVCPCCGSRYDRSGRVRIGPAPKNLIVPDYSFIDDTLISIEKRSWR